VRMRHPLHAAATGDAGTPHPRYQAIAPNPKSQTPNPKPQTPNPQPKIMNPNPKP